MFNLVVLTSTFQKWY